MRLEFGDLKKRLEMIVHDIDGLDIEYRDKSFDIMITSKLKFIHKTLLYRIAVETAIFENVFYYCSSHEDKPYICIYVL